MAADQGQQATNTFCLSPINDSYIHAVDISPKMVEYAKSHFSHPRVSYTVGNILSNDFPLANLMFDKIFSVYVFYYVKDYR